MSRRKQDKPIEHGTASAYTYSGCRCAECKAGNARRKLEAYHRRRDRVIADPSIVTHGTYTAANTWGCPCEQCRVAYRDYVYRDRPGRRDMHGRRRRAVAVPFGREWLDSVQ